MQIEDLKEGMKLKSIKNAFYVDKSYLDNGLMLEEDLMGNLIKVIGEGEIRIVKMDEESVYLIDESGECNALIFASKLLLNEGWFELKDMLNKGVFEIV